jgi:fermentation-respiration switch protein FrsA (DUF1100 family)
MADGGDNLDLRILGVEAGDEIAGARRLSLKTTRGAIPIVLHAPESASRAVVCLSGALGGLDGPALLYARMGAELPRRGIAVARVDYRAPNDFSECLLDALAAVAFLKGTGYQRAALIGHSFGGAVAINAGTLNPIVVAVIAISSQLAGAQVVNELAPKPLLLIHGTADEIIAQRSSELIFERAGEPRQLELIAGGDHRLSGFGDRLLALAGDWLAALL